MGKPKGRVQRGKQKGWRRTKRERKGDRELSMKKALGIPKHEVLPHLVGRRAWRGMRDYAPHENGPVRVRKAKEAR